jgi:predicted XRE-type DNA-binding protein
VTTMSRSRPASIDLAASQMFAHFFHAFLECDPSIQDVVRDMAEIINDPDTDADDRALALSTLHEALFPARSPHDGMLGVDLEDEESHAMGEESEIQEDFNRQEDGFARCVEGLLRERNMTQGQLAEAIGVKQPAIAMMLGRKARPQRRTVEKVARALNVAPERLWPGFA